MAKAGVISAQAGIHKDTDRSGSAARIPAWAGMTADVVGESSGYCCRKTQRVLPGHRRRLIPGGDMAASLIFALSCAVLALLYGWASIVWILKQPAGTPRMREIAAA